jgi:hypothetical protein
MKSEYEIDRIGSCFPILSAFKRKEINLLKIFPKKILKHMRLAKFYVYKGKTDIGSFQLNIWHETFKL